MELKLMNEPDLRLSTVEQILLNRGIEKEDIYNYLHAGESCIESYKNLCCQDMLIAVETIEETAKSNLKTAIIVDCDCDGYTSAAILLNYLHELYPEWTENIKIIHHSGKSHGLPDCLDTIVDYNPALVLIPDAGSNNFEEHKILKEKGIECIVLDHHLADYKSNHALIINNQLCDYKNKELSGAGVVWQFCRCMDDFLGVKNADKYRDLVALGLCGDMMSLLSIETKYLISSGFREDNIRNPFIKYMLDKNSFPLSKADYKSSSPEQACTSMGAAFFVVPFVNATTRTGTIEEKEKIFDSMLTFKAFQQVPEVKRNKETGNMEKLVESAVRLITNVKNRQTKEENAGMELLERKIKNEGLLNNKVLAFVLKPEELRSEIRGLVANKMAAKYQRPCCVLTNSEGELYEGSMRGYTKTGLNDFRSVLLKCDGVEYCEGHHNAAGVGIRKDQFDKFIAKSNELLADISTEQIHYIDYFFNSDSVDAMRILEISSLNDLWGQDVSRSYVGIRFRVTPDNFYIMKSNTLKIGLNGVSLIKFGGTEEDIENFTTQGWKEVIAVCKCAENEWMGRVSAQLVIEEYEVVGENSYVF